MFSEARAATFSRTSTVSLKPAPFPFTVPLCCHWEKLGANLGKRLFIQSRRSSVLRSSLAGASHPRSYAACIPGQGGRIFPIISHDRSCLRGGPGPFGPGTSPYSPNLMQVRSRRTGPSGREDLHPSMDASPLGPPLARRRVITPLPEEQATAAAMGWGEAG